MPRSATRRISSFYFFTYAAFGTFVPYLAVFFSRKGMSDVEIGLLFATGPILTFFSPPLWGLLCDATGDRRMPLVLTLALSALTFPVLLLAEGFWAALVLLVAFNFFLRPSLSVGDAAAIEYAQVDKGDYGRLRTWGSIGFIFSVGVLNFLLRHEAGEDVPAGHLSLIFAAYSLFALLAAASAWKLPLVRVPRFNNIFNWPCLSRLLTPNLVILLASSFVHSAVMWGFYTFFPLHLDHIGVPDNLKGAFWVIAVVPEAAFLYFAGAISNRFGKKWLYVSGLAGSALRLGIVASTRSPWVVALSQFLHALSFGASYFATVTLVDSQVPAELRTTGQSFAFGIGTGLGGTIGTLAAGKLASLSSIPAVFAGGAVIVAATALFAARFLSDSDPARSGRPYNHPMDFRTHAG